MLTAPRRGTVYGTLLNHPEALAALGPAAHAAPYHAPPRAPVLCIKPRNTWIADGEPIVVPDGVTELEMGATLGLVIGRVACRVPFEQALDAVAGYVVVNDVSVPHASHYRPALRFKARDTFCPIGPFVRRAAVAVPDALSIVVSVDGSPVRHATTRGLLRPAARLLADVSEFMTLWPGDVLTLGVPGAAPRARAGQRVAIEIDGLGRLENPLVGEAP